MITLKYEEFINKLNDYKIRKMSFSVKNYAHYNNCLLEVKELGSGYYVWIYLTKDRYEWHGCLLPYEEDKKIFKIKNIGFMTLKQYWDNILINTIEYFNN